MSHEGFGALISQAFVKPTNDPEGRLDDGHLNPYSWAAVELLEGLSKVHQQQVGLPIGAQRQRDLLSCSLQALAQESDKAVDAVTLEAIPRERVIGSETQEVIVRLHASQGLSCGLVSVTMPHSVNKGMLEQRSTCLPL